LKVLQRALLDANERQKTRETALSAELGKLEKQKAAVMRPDQTVKVLPEGVPLPTSLSLSGGRYLTGG
jgi:hypothetical protein